MLKTDRLLNKELIVLATLLSKIPTFGAYLPFQNKYPITMSPYGLRLSPKPSKRVVEAGELADKVGRAAKKQKRSSLEESESIEKAAAGDASQASNKKPSPGDKTATNSKPGKCKKKVAVQPTKKRKATSQKPNKLKKAPEKTRSSQKISKSKTGKTWLGVTSSENNDKPKASGPLKRDLEEGENAKLSSEKRNAPSKFESSNLDTDHTLTQSAILNKTDRNFRKDCVDYTRAHQALDASRTVLQAATTPSPERTSTPPPKKRRKTVTPDNTAHVRSLAKTRGPQSTSDETGRDTSPTTLPSPEIPHTSLHTNSDILPLQNHVEHLQKRLVRGLESPTYSLFDIVSGGKPPSSTTKEEGRLWQEEELPDRYGKTWRCVKVLDAGFGESVVWDEGVGERTSEARRKSGEDMSPSMIPDVSSMTEGELSEFEKEVEGFLSAFGEEGWEEGLEEIEGLDFGEDG